ncbi:TPA: hypothetical protein SMV65_001464 [Proteus mirabilis]|nr:hypothetical protein [Proteus mirabilis]
MMDTEHEKLKQAANELETVHYILDELKIPRVSDGKLLCLWARICLFRNISINQKDVSLQRNSTTIK